VINVISCLVPRTLLAATDIVDAILLEFTYSKFLLVYFSLLNSGSLSGGSSVIDESHGVLHDLTVFMSLWNPFCDTMIFFVPRNFTMSNPIQSNASIPSVP
jgi:hypothetical protein